MLAQLKAQLKNMNAGLKTPPAEIDLAMLMPLLAPAEFFAGKWCGPSTRLRSPHVALTWAIMLPGQTMRYVEYGMEEYWNAQGIDWKNIAMANLSKRSDGKPGAFESRNANGATNSIAFMFNDGFGPSRLLFRRSLKQLFPNGYRVAIPERSCAFAFAADLEGKPKEAVDAMIDNCHRKGTRPFLAGSFEGDDLLPAEPEAGCQDASSAVVC